jgi:nucleoid-associated protein YgaU
MIDETSLLTAREETLSPANPVPSSRAPQPHMQGDEYQSGQTQSLSGDSQAKPLQPTAIQPDNTDRDRARGISLAVHSEQRFDEPNNGPAAPLQNERVGNGFEPTSPAENRLTPQPGAAGADPTGRAVHRTHRTTTDESLWSISLAYYGRGSYFRALYEHNRRRIVRPDQLEPNVLIEIPSTEELRHWYPALCPAP